MSKTFDIIRGYCNKRITKKKKRIISLSDLYVLFEYKKMLTIDNYKRLLVRSGYCESATSGGDFIVLKEIPDKIKDNPKYPFKIKNK